MSIIPSRSSGDTPSDANSVARETTGSVLLDIVSAEQVALIPQCAECGDVWLPVDGDRRKAYFDTDDQLVFFCPDCAEREFGQPRSSA
jgi:hypothetical protein